MQAGQLRRPIKIKQPVKTTDGAGGYTQIWQDVCETMAAIEPMTGKEIYYAGQTQENLTVKITMRYRPGIKPAWRIYDGNTVYQISAIIDIGTRAREMQVLAEKLESEAMTASIDTPNITGPRGGATGCSRGPTIDADAFAVTGGTDTHAATQWQIATASNPDFGTVLFDMITTTAKTSITLPPDYLQYETEYTVRVKYTGTTAGSSAWSAAINFTTLEEPAP
jgi:SPP1 family predicted phage head-tail adaptor